eukprot:gene33141-40097_t
MKPVLAESDEKSSEESENEMDDLESHSSDSGDGGSGSDSCSDDNSDGSDNESCSDDDQEEKDDDDEEDVPIIMKAKRKRSAAVGEKAPAPAPKKAKKAPAKSKKVGEKKAITKVKSKTKSNSSRKASKKTEGARKASNPKDTGAADSLDPLLDGDFYKSIDAKRLFKKRIIDSKVVRDDEYEALLKALANNSTHVEELHHGIKAISVDRNQLGGLEMPFGIEGIGSHVLFERSFYNDLLAAVCGKRNGAALIGSEGTSKSTWLHWYLYKVMQAVKQGVNLPSCRRVQEGRAPPELIVYQQGSDDVYYFLTREKIAYSAETMHLSLILDLFDTNKVAYLFEPLTCKMEPKAVPGLFTAIAAPPDPIRYKEFTKTRVRLYMPTYEEEELVTIGEHLKGLVQRDKDEEGLTEDEAAELLELYSEESVRQCFRLYGGIIRRALPRAKESLESDRSDMNDALSTVAASNLDDFQSIKKLLSSDQLTTTGSFLVQWNPKVSVGCHDENKKQYNFWAKGVRFASAEIERRVEIMCDRLTIDQLRSNLLDMMLYMDIFYPLITSLFKKYVFLYLAEDHQAFSSVMEGLPRTKVKGTRGKPSYAAMEKNTVYYPQMTYNNFAAVEMYIKSSSLLYVIQVSKTQGNKECKNSALAAFLKEIDMPVEDALSKLRIVYCRLHKNSEWQLSYWK